MCHLLLPKDTCNNQDEKKLYDKPQKLSHYLKHENKNHLDKTTWRKTKVHIRRHITLVINKKLE
jgi:hypothetical protein